jgi:starch-binding outer membrane protein, SusD/RagB family
MFSKRAVMRTTARRALVSAVAAVGLAACSLEETGANFISPDRFYQNDAQAASAVNGVYAPLMDWNGWKQPAQHSIMCDDNEMLCWNWMGGGFSGQSAGQWYMQGNAVWFGDYQIIERANQVVANVARSSGITQAMKRTATGQALFARGYAYFDLVRRYGGVPLRVEPYAPDDRLGAQARDSVAEVYQQIAKDLRDAAGLLPPSYNTPNGQGLPRAVAAWGLLAKVYLHMAGDQATGTPLAANKAAYLDSAALAAQEVMTSGTASLEASYMDLFDVTKQNTSPEILFAVQGATVNLLGSNIPSFFGPRGDCSVVGGCGQGFISVREDFYRTFEAGDKRVEPNRAIAHTWEVTYSSLGKVRAIHSDSLQALRDDGLVVQDSTIRLGGWSEGCGSFDQRYDSLTLKDAADTSQRFTVIYAVGRPVYSLKYIDPQHTGSEYAPANNFVVLRYADVLLIFAEAENERNGPTAAAYAAINEVRQRAGLAPLAGLSQAAFRQAAWTERSHELYGEFQARFDLIREGRWLDVMNRPSTITDYAPHGICRPRQAYQKLQPIPQRELAANPLLRQNAGY